MGSPGTAPRGPAGVSPYLLHTLLILSVIPWDPLGSSPTETQSDVDKLNGLVPRHTGDANPGLSLSPSPRGHSVNVPGHWPGRWRLLWDSVVPPVFLVTVGKSLPSARFPICNIGNVAQAVYVESQGSGFLGPTTMTSSSGCWAQVWDQALSTE